MMDALMNIRINRVRAALDKGDFTAVEKLSADCLGLAQPIRLGDASISPKYLFSCRYPYLMCPFFLHRHCQVFAINPISRCSTFLLRLGVSTPLPNVGVLMF